MKVKNNKLQSDSSKTNSELSEYKRQYNFKVPKEDIDKCKILKSNYLPEDNIVEIALPMNLHLRGTSFDAIHQIILALILKEKKSLKDCPIKVEEHNYFDYFVAACCLQIEELALRIYEEKIKKELSVRLLIDVLLLTLEYNLLEASSQFYQIFRDYWIYRQGLTDRPTATTEKLFEVNDGSSLLYEQDEQFHIYEKLELMFSFSPNVFKKVFDNFRKAQFDKYLKPETRYHVLKVLRKRNHDGDEALWQSSYPHRYSLVYDHKDEVILSGVRYSEYGSFFFFAKTSNETPYSENYVGCVEPNAWGTVFDVYDDGMDEKSLSSLPKFLCSPRKKIASIVYNTNILGEAPRAFKVAFYDFLEKKASQVESLKPRFDAKNDCYTLNFYGRAREASARNFILIYPDDPDSIMLMHGKTSKDAFNLDFRHLFNFIQAFGVSLVSIGKKFCVA